MTTRADVVFADDFTAGFDAEPAGASEPRWTLRPAAGLVDGDGRVSTGDGTLVVEPTDRNPTTGAPCFVRSEDGPGDLRWAALTTGRSTAGFPGFEVSPGERLAVAATLSARADGLSGHPYGDAVDDRGRDTRLAAAGLIVLDRETGIVFDVLVTDQAVHAVYERLGPPDAEQAAYSYRVPVLDREPDQVHQCTVTYDRAAGVVRWSVDGRDVLAVTEIGLRCLDVAYRVRDNDRPDRSETPRQLAVGLGLFAERAYGQGIRLAVQDVTVRRETGP